MSTLCFVLDMPFASFLPVCFRDRRLLMTYDSNEKLYKHFNLLMLYDLNTAVRYLLSRSDVYISATIS